MTILRQPYVVVLPFIMLFEMALNFQALNKNYFHMILFDMLQELVSIFHSVDMATLFLNLNLKFARCKHLHKVTCTAYNAP